MSGRKTCQFSIIVYISINKFGSKANIKKIHLFGVDFVMEKTFREKFRYLGKISSFFPDETLYRFVTENFRVGSFLFIFYFFFNQQLLNANSQSMITQRHILLANFLT